MSRNAYINKDIPLSKIHEVKADLKHYIEFYEKITFIEDIYAGETVKYAIEKRGKTIPTGHAWLKAWNEKGFDGLLRKKGSGRKTKLTENQFKQLKENIIKKQLTSVREVKHEIIEEFGVVYRICQGCFSRMIHSCLVWMQNLGCASHIVLERDGCFCLRR